MIVLHLLIFVSSMTDTYRCLPELVGLFSMSPTVGWSLDTGKLLHCDGLCFIVASHAYSHTTLLLLPCPVSLLCYPCWFRFSFRLLLRVGFSWCAFFALVCSPRSFSRDSHDFRLKTTSRSYNKNPTVK